MRINIQSFFIVALGLLMAGGLAYFVTTNQRNLNESALIDGARNYSEFFTEMRSFYLTEILSRVGNSDIIITHDYRNLDNALPIPATMSLDFGEYLAEHSSDVTVALISDYPFPWRADRSLTEFDETAIAHLRTIGAGEYSEIFDENGLPYLHYASPVLMSQGCVDCHNNHPDSPKTDWRVGDIRGIQVVEIPVNDAITALDYEIAVVLAIISTIGFIVIMTLLVLNQRSVYAAESLKAQNKRLEAARQSVAEANQAKSVFLANMNQDIRTPLYSIVGMLSLIDTASLSVRNKDTFSIIKRSSDALLRIVTESVKFQNRDQINEQLNTGNCDIRATLENASNPFRLIAEHAHSKFTLEVKDTVPQFIQLDEAKTEQLLSTLLSLVNVNSDMLAATLTVATEGFDGNETKKALNLDLDLKSNNVKDASGKLVATLSTLTNFAEQQSEQSEQSEQSIIITETIDRILVELNAKIFLQRQADNRLLVQISVPYETSVSGTAIPLADEGDNSDNSLEELAITAPQDVHVSIVNRNKIHTNIISNIFRKYGIEHSAHVTMPKIHEFGEEDVNRIILLDVELHAEADACDINKLRNADTKLVIVAENSTEIDNLGEVTYDAVLLKPVTAPKVAEMLATLFPNKMS